MPTAAVVIHPKAAYTPDILLRGLINIAGEMKTVAFVYISDEGEVSCGHSPATNQQLALMQMALDRHVRGWIFEDG